MALYRYIKHPPRHHHRKEREEKHQESSPKRRRRFPLTSAFLMGTGLVIISWVLWPIFSFELFVSAKYQSVIKPIPDEVVAVAFENQFGRLLATSTVDYTKARNWFPKYAPSTEVSHGKQVAYTLSIPKLRINEAKVVIGGDDLDKSLIHYGESALPGEYGNTVVFGHSTLPIFFNPDNYLTIFSTLPTLQNGDSIIVKSDSTTYRYIVYDMKVVLPEDISVLEQKYDWSYVSLITCVPPGTYWKRLIVRGRLEKI